MHCPTYKRQLYLAQGNENNKNQCTETTESKASGLMNIRCFINQGPNLQNILRSSYDKICLRIIVRQIC